MWHINDIHNPQSTQNHTLTEYDVMCIEAMTMKPHLFKTIS